MRAVRSRLARWGASGDAIIITPDKPWKLILWRQAQYVPCWDLGGDVWFTPEWLETHSPEDPHCYEPIMDKDCRYMSVQLLHSGPARASAQWNYALCNSLYRIFNGNTRAEERYHVYPDGLAVRHLAAWPGDASAVSLNPTQWEMQEFILVHGPGVRPQDTIEPVGITFTNLAGDTIDIAWPNPFDGWTPLCSVYPQFPDWSEYIGLVHLRDRPQPFVVWPKNQLLFPYTHCPHCGKEHPQTFGFKGDSSYSHWPVNPSTDFVGWVEASPDEVGRIPTHTSFASTGYDYSGATPPRPSSWLFLTGAVTQGLEEARSLAASWLRPARVEASQPFEGYSYSERAYRIRRIDQDRITITLKPRQPIINPVFRIYFAAPPVTVLCNGDSLDSDQARFQALGEDLLLWLNMTVDSETSFEFIIE